MQIQFPMRVTAFAIFCGLTLTLSPRPAQAFFFDPPDTRSPSSLGGGLRRGGCDADEASGLVAEQGTSAVPFLPLMPDQADVLSLTTQAQPKFWVYVPPTSAHEIEFELYDSQANTVVYSAQLAVETPGLYALTLPPGVELKASSTDTPYVYEWVFALVCNPNSRELDLNKGGSIARVAPDSTLTQALGTAKTNVERANAYGVNSIWLDAVNELVQDRTSLEGSSAWQSLLGLVLPNNDREDVDRPGQINRLQTVDLHEFQNLNAQ